MIVDEVNASIDWIRANPEQHDQRAWARRAECGTKMCMAGVTVLRHGYTFAFPNLGDYRSSEAVRCVGPDGESEQIPTVAARILGLTPAEAGAFFQGSGGLDDLIEVRDRILRGDTPYFDPLEDDVIRWDSALTNTC